MLQIQLMDEDNVRMYYAYVKALMLCNQYLCCAIVDEREIKKLLQEIEGYHSKMKNEYLEGIRKRIIYLTTQSIYTRLKYFYDYLLTKFFHMNELSEDDPFDTNFIPLPMYKNHVKENSTNLQLELTDIFHSELQLKLTPSSVLNHKSIYNSQDILPFLNSRSTKNSIIYFFEHFFLWLEDYFTIYQKTNQTILNDDGFIPQPWRYYIAIMAVSTMRSEYMLQILEERFLDVGGDESWLIYGLDVVPVKLKLLSKINNVIAHQPWRLTIEDIEELNQKNDKDGDSMWNLNELMHAAVIMIHFHKIAGIVESLKIRSSAKQTCSTTVRRLKSNSTDITLENKSNRQNSKTLKEKMLKNLEEIIKSEEYINNDNEAIEAIETIETIEAIETIAKIQAKESNNISNKSENIPLNFFGDINNNINNNNNSNSTSPSKKNQISQLATLFLLDNDKCEVEKEIQKNEEPSSSPSSIFEKHIHKFCQSYQDFDSHNEQYQSFLEFNWLDQGYYILRNLFSPGVDCMNEEIEYITSLTTNTLGEDMGQLNTNPIRRAVAYYVEKIFGYLHEDYNYSNVKKLLVGNYRVFIKNVACWPCRLRRKDFELMNLAFNNEEIMHIIFLVEISKSSIQLTYFANRLYEVIKNID